MIRQNPEATARAARAYFKCAPAEGSVWRASALKNEGKANYEKC